MHIKRSIKFYKRELNRESHRMFLNLFISYSLLASIFYLPIELFPRESILELKFIRWKLANIGCLVILAILIFLDRIHIKLSGLFITALQTYLFICFSIWKYNNYEGQESYYILNFTLVANIDWKYCAASGLIANIFEALMTFQSKGFSLESGLAMTNFINRVVFIALGAFMRQKTYQRLFGQYEKDKTCLLNLQNLIKNVFPSSILIIQDRKVIFQNLETRRLLRYPKFQKIEDILNKILITEFKPRSDFMESFQSFNEEKNELRLFDYLQRSANDFESAYEFEEIYGKIEDFDCDIIYREITQASKLVEIKIARIMWEGEESQIVIMSEDNRGEKIIAEQARYKDKLLATVSHDLRTPLNGVIGLIEMAIELISEKVIKKSLTVALRSSRLLMFMINDILDYSLISNSKLRLKSVAFDLAQALKEVSKLIKFQAKNKGLRFEMENKLSLTEVIPFNSDPNRLKQVILNLLSNSLKFTQKGFIKLSVEPHEQPASVLISVADSGIGIKKEDVPKLFKFFGKLETEESRRINTNGIGMGLAISQSLVRRLNNYSGDEIQVVSEYGKGSVFSFILRDLKMKSDSITLINEEILDENCMIESVRQMNVKTIQEHPRLIQVSTRVSDTRNSEPLQRCTKIKSILVVDDDQINIMVFTTYLKSFPDCIFDLAFNGQQALQLILERAENKLFYDMIFMDCNMPIMDGFEATRRIIEMELNNIIPHVPIIASTANVSPSDYEFCFQNGMVDYMSKPFGKQTLREKIDKHFKL